MIDSSRRTLLPPIAAALALFAGGARAQGPGSAPAEKPAAPADRGALVEDLVAANRILADLGVLDGYGHVSARDPAHPGHFLMSRSRAPELVAAGDILVHDLDGNTPEDPKAKTFLERFIHAEIYRARPEVMAIVHCHSPSLIPFGIAGVALRPVYHMSAFLGGGAPVFEIRKAGGMTDLLVSTPGLGKTLAAALGDHAVALRRGHGAVVVGPDVRTAVFRAYYTEMNARLQAQAMALGKPVVYLSPEEARLAARTLGGTIGRPWELWRRKALGGQ